MEKEGSQSCICGAQSKLMACSRCKKTGYCSKACQIQDWPEHKQMCKEQSSQKSAGNSDKDRTGVNGNAGVCQFCGASGPVKTCKGCKMATYCSRDCQRADWGSGHKLNCRNKTSAFVSFCENSVVPRPPGSLERAKAIAAMKFPGDKIIDDFYDLPTEYSVRFESNVLVGFMFKVHPYFMRHGVYLKDKNDGQLQVMFYVDYDNPLPYFTWDDITPGNYLCIRNASVHHFIDGSIGIRVDEACDVQIIRP